MRIYTGEKHKNPHPHRISEGVLAAQRMALGNIEIDVNAFKRKVKNSDPNDITTNYLPTKGGLEIPVQEIPIKRFIHDRGQMGGVGEGEGYGPGNQPGDETAPHTFTVEFDTSEIIRKLAEELNIKVSGKGGTISYINKVVTNRRGGYKRNMLKTMKRIIPWCFDENGQFDYTKVVFNLGNPFFLRWNRLDKREKFDSSALIIYVLDVSGSMTQQRIQSARQLIAWSAELLSVKYRGSVDQAIIAHDIEAQLVGKVPASKADIQTALRIQPAGGTDFIKAFQLVAKILENYKKQTAIHIVQLTDGEPLHPDTSLAALAELLGAQNIAGFYYANLGNKTFTNPFTGQTYQAKLQTLFNSGKFSHLKEIFRSTDVTNNIWPALKALLSEKK